MKTTIAIVVFAFLAVIIVIAAQVIVSPGRVRVVVVEDLKQPYPQPSLDLPQPEVHREVVTAAGPQSVLSGHEFELGGRVVDWAGVAIPAVLVERRRQGEALEHISTDDQGAFSFSARPNGSDSFHLFDSAYVTLRAGREHDTNSPTLIVGSRKRGVTGAVLSEETTYPVVAATVSFHVGTAWAPLLGSSAEWDGYCQEAVRTDASGRFVFQGMPDIVGSYIAVRKPGYKTKLISDIPRGEADVLALLSPGNAVRGLEGLVVAVNQTPISGAYVSLGDTVVQTDGGGRFAIDGDLKNEGQTLQVVAKGVGTTAITVDDRQGYVIVVVPANAGRIEGLVVDELGNSIADAIVYIDGKLPLGTEVSAELAASAPMVLTRHVSVEDKLGNTDGALVSDSEGAFAFIGAAGRQYTVTVFDDETLVSATAPMSVASGSLVRFVLDRRRVTRRTGRILDARGRPRVGVSVAACVNSLKVPMKGAVVQTDDRGRFEVEVPQGMEDMTLSVSGGSILPVMRRVNWSEGPANIVIQCRREAIVEWGSAKPGSSVSAHAVDGKIIPISYNVRSAFVTGKHIPVLGSNSGIILMPENVDVIRWMDIHYDNQETRVQWAATGVTLVRL